jgi:hypothetical protein
MSGEWASTVVVVVAFVAAMGFLELVVRYLSPAPSEDPRLGATAFWIWVVAVGAVTYLLWPSLERSERLLDRIVFGIGVVGWLAWKLGVGGSWEDTPREREEIWATTVGTFAGMVAWELRH